MFQHVGDDDLEVEGEMSVRMSKVVGMERGRAGCGWWGAPDLSCCCSEGGCDLGLPAVRDSSAVTAALVQEEVEVEVEAGVSGGGDVGGHVRRTHSEKMKIVDERWRQGMWNAGLGEGGERGGAGGCRTALTCRRLRVCMQSHADQRGMTSTCVRACLCACMRTHMQVLTG